jgi:hypothetical protein
MKIINKLDETIPSYAEIQLVINGGELPLPYSDEVYPVTKKKTDRFGKTVYIAKKTRRIKMKTACKDCKYVRKYVAGGMDWEMLARCAAAPPSKEFNSYYGQETKQPYCSEINKGNCELYERREDG